MSAFKGTPGPWEIESRTTSTPGVDVAWSIRNSGWYTIAGGQSQEHLGESGIHALECSANARLIAAAPELLEALKKMVERITYYAELKEDDAPNIEDWAYTYKSGDMSVAIAAIAKATGGQP